MKKPPSKYAFYIIFWITILTPSFETPAQAQTHKQPFETCEIGINLLFNTNRNSFHDYFEPKTGIEGQIEMPFYVGIIQTGIQVLPYLSRSNDIPDYQSWFLYLGWGEALRLPFNVTWFNGFRVGGNRMSFEDDQISKYGKTENELCASLNSRLRCQVYNQWAVSISAGHMVVFTHRKIELAYISTGISYNFKTPEWAVRFLQ